MEIQHLEQGYDFITLFFKSPREQIEAARLFYIEARRRKFEHIELQRKNMMHIPGDVPHFHSDGDPKDRYGESYSHFHVLYPHKPTKKDWDEVIKIAERINLSFRPGIRTRNVKK